MHRDGSMTSENTLIRAVPCTTCGAQLLWTQNAWHAGGHAGAAYVCRNRHVVDSAETRQCPACGVHDTELTSTSSGPQQHRCHRYGHEFQVPR